MNSLAPLHRKPVLPDKPTVELTKGSHGTESCTLTWINHTILKHYSKTG